MVSWALMMGRLFSAAVASSDNDDGTVILISTPPQQIPTQKIQINAKYKELALAKHALEDQRESSTNELKQQNPAFFLFLFFQKIQKIQKKSTKF
jgi:hypothetical protein